MFARDNRWVILLLSVLYLEHSCRHGKPVYHGRDYAVTPLGAWSSLIQWVDSSTPLFGLCKRWQQWEAITMMQVPKQVLHYELYGFSGLWWSQVTGSLLSVPQLPPQVLKPNELFYSKINSYTEREGGWGCMLAHPNVITNRDYQRVLFVRTGLIPFNYVQVLEELMADTPNYLLSCWLITYSVPLW